MHFYRIIGIIFFLLGNGQLVHGQLNIDRELIGVTGNTSNAGSLNLSSSVGEVITSFETNGSLNLSQGFQQGEVVILGVEEELISLSYEVFPNPTNGKVSVKISSSEPIQLQLILYDLHGRSCGIESPLYWVTQAHVFELDLTSLSSATYLLAIEQKERIVKTIRIRKKD